MNSLLCLCGPTGAGKSAVSLRIAQFLEAQGLQGVVINADSRQLYRDFPVITAQPSPEDKAVCPHHLYGYLGSDEKSSAGSWAVKAKAALEAAWAQGHIPLLVGGTGLYLRALLDGMVDIPSCPAHILASLQKSLAEQGLSALYERLQSVDPQSAQRIHPNDTQRVLRGLEVWEGTGKSLSDWHQDTPAPQPWRVLRLGVALPMPELEPLLAQRIGLMLKAGAVDEAKAAWSACPNLQAPAWNGIGCAELGAWLAGSLEWEKCLALWRQNTRAYAKRQFTWFRSDARIHWFSPNQHEELLKIVPDFIEV